MKILRLFDLPLANASMESAIDTICQRLKSRQYSPVYFINAHCVNVSFKDLDYQKQLRLNELNFADGIGMSMASRWFGQPLVDNVNGTDMFPLLCQRLSNEGSKVFLLGGEAGVAERLRDNLLVKYPTMQVVGLHHGHFQAAQSEKIAEKIKASGAELVFVAMGVPRQEHWIARYGSQSGATVLLAVGGLFNFYAGVIPRAPLWMRRNGLEWLHRMLQEPGRMWKRYLIGNVEFLMRMVVWNRMGRLRDLVSVFAVRKQAAPRDIN